MHAGGLPGGGCGPGPAKVMAALTTGASGRGRKKWKEVFG